MLTIIRWIFSIALFFLLIYLLLLGYNAIKKEGLGNVLSPISDGLSSLFSNTNMPATATTTKNIFADFFTPKQIAAPMVVVPSQAWYENMDAVYKQIYLNNLNSINYSNAQTSSGFSYDSYFQQYQTSRAPSITTNTASGSRLKLLFPTPSTYMQLRNYMKDFEY